MDSIYQKIWTAATPYLDTRNNDIHARISWEMAEKILEKDGGDRDIVVPAIILHDIGYKTIPEEKLKQAFGKVVRAPELQREHEVKGAEMAREILDGLGYDPAKTGEIVAIIDGHDTRSEALSLNDQIVKDADKLYRFSKDGFRILARYSFEEFGELPLDRVKRFRTLIDKWMFTDTAKEIARGEIEERSLEYPDNKI